MLAALAWSGFLHAQSNDAAGGQSPPATTYAVTLDPSPKEVIDTTAINASSDIGGSESASYVALLNGAGLVPLSSIARAHLLLAGTSSSGFDSNPGNFTNGPSSYFGLISPYLGFQAVTLRSQWLFQYQPSIDVYTHSDVSTMHTASVNLSGSAAPRWSWNGSVSGSYGQDSIRLSAPNQGVAIGNVPGAGSVSASYQPNAGIVTNLSSTLDVHYGWSARSNVGIAVSDSFHSSSSLHDKGSVATVSANFSHYITQKISFQAYQQTSQYYGNLSCTTVGGGAGVNWQPRQNTFISITGGPQLSSSGCQNNQAFAYSVSTSMNVPSRAQVYFTADRRPVINELGAGLWQDDVSGGYRRQISIKDAVSVDLGYAHSSTLVQMPTYHGTFYYLAYIRSLRPGVTFGCSYRSYSSDSGSTQFARKIVLFSLSWTQSNTANSR